MEFRHVVLVGLSGAGKSTVGRLLAERLGRPFIDLDRRLEADSNMSVSDIFAKLGESEFRRRESTVLRAVLQEQESVIAAGGGTLVAAVNRKLIHESSRTIWLSVSPMIAAARVSESEHRPLLASDPTGNLERLLKRRKSSYAEADMVIETDSLTAREVADSLFALIVAGEPS